MVSTSRMIAGAFSFAVLAFIGIGLLVTWVLPGAPVTPVKVEERPLPGPCTKVFRLRPEDDIAYGPFYRGGSYYPDWVVPLDQTDWQKPDSVLTDQNEQTIPATNARMLEILQGWKAQRLDKVDLIDAGGPDTTYVGIQMYADNAAMFKQVLDVATKRCGGLKLYNNRPNGKPLFKFGVLQTGNIIFKVKEPRYQPGNEKTWPRGGD